MPPPRPKAAGWEGLFTWDGITIGEGMPIHDPWLIMAAIAMRTERARIGAILTPPSRRRPWKLARETMTLRGAERRPAARHQGPGGGS